MRLTILTDAPFERGQKIRVQRKKTGFTPVELEGTFLTAIEGQLKVQVGGAEVTFKLAGGGYVGYIQ